MNGQTLIQSILVFIWAIGTPAGWIAYYRSASIRFSEPELFLNALRTFSIPYLVFSIALVIVILFGSNMRVLLELKKTIDQAPESLGEALEKATEIKRNIDEAGSELNNRLEQSIADFRIESEAELSKFVSSFRAVHSSNFGLDDIEQSSIDPGVVSKSEFFPFLTIANRLFYKALDVHNSDKRRDPMTVSRGGGNRPTLASDLREKKIITENEYRFIEEVFKKEMSLRQKDSIQAQDISYIDRLRQQADISSSELEISQSL